MFVLFAPAQCGILCLGTVQYCVVIVCRLWYSMLCYHSISVIQYRIVSRHVVVISTTRL